MNLKKLATGIICMCLAKFSTMAFAQNKEFKGKVTDSKDGSVIAGISVQGITVSGKKVGTATSTDGTFNLSTADGIVKVILSGAGFDKMEVYVNGKSEVAVSMVSSNTSLNEVVVIGYGTARKKDLTGAVSTVQAKDFNKGTYTSADQLIQGKVAGVQMINNSGAPGGASTVKIRGNSTVTGTGQPLYIVDGVEVTANDFSSLNSGDFESIAVLKDAISTSQYGSRGANGVIVISTKKGKSGATKLNYDVQYGESNLPESKLILMNSQQKLDYEVANGNPYGWTAAELTDLRKIDTNWEDVLYRTGKTAAHTLSASGGNEKTTFFLSGSYFDQSGTVEETGLKRTTGRANIESKSGNFNFGLTSSFFFFFGFSSCTTGASISSFAIMLK